MDLLLRTSLYIYRIWEILGSLMSVVQTCSHKIRDKSQNLIFDVVTRFMLFRLSALQWYIICQGYCLCIWGPKPRHFCEKFLCFYWSLKCSIAISTQVPWRLVAHFVRIAYFFSLSATSVFLQQIEHFAIKRSLFVIPQYLVNIGSNWHYNSYNK